MNNVVMVTTWTSLIKANLAMATRECPVSHPWRLTPSPQYGTIPRGSSQLSGWQVAYTGSLLSWEGQCWVYLLLLLFVYFWLCCMTCDVLVPQPGIEPEPPAVKAPNPNHWTARDSFFAIFCLKYIYIYTHIAMKQQLRQSNSTFFHDQKSSSLLTIQ